VQVYTTGGVFAIDRRALVYMLQRKNAFPNAFAYVLKNKKTLKTAENPLKNTLGNALKNGFSRNPG